MSRTRGGPPALVPILSRGKHRNARKGACFMEMASFLSGERWSDHPACTHPLLAELARLVNDNTADDARQRLAPLIPSVIGVNGEDIRIDADLALMCALVALPVASAERQRALAVGVLSCERLIAELDGRPLDDVRPASQAVLAQVPEACFWAGGFSNGMTVTQRVFRAQTAPRIVSLAIEGIAAACIPDASDRLSDLLVRGVARARLLTGAGVDDGAETAALTDGAQRAGSQSLVNRA